MSRSPNLKNIIVLSQDWWNKCEVGDTFQNQDKKEIISKKSCLKIHLNAMKDDLGELLESFDRVIKDK